MSPNYKHRHYRVTKHLLNYYIFMFRDKEKENIVYTNEQNKKLIA